MNYLQTIQLTESPRQTDTKKGHLSHEQGKVHFRQYDVQGTKKTLAYSENVPVFETFHLDTASTIHIVQHNMNSRSLILTYQLDEGGFPGRYVHVDCSPTLNNEQMSITIYTSLPSTLFVNILRAQRA